MMNFAGSRSADITFWCNCIDSVPHLMAMHLSS